MFVWSAFLEFNSHNLGIDWIFDQKSLAFINSRINIPFGGCWISGTTDSVAMNGSCFFFERYFTNVYSFIPQFSFAFFFLYLFFSFVFVTQFTFTQKIIHRRNRWLTQRFQIKHIHIYILIRFKIRNRKKNKRKTLFLPW